MTYAPTLATGNGSQVDFSFTFPYLSQLDVKVTVNDVLTTAFTFFSTSIIRFDTAPANGAEVVIFRETPTEDLSTVIQPGSALPVDGLNDNFLQSLYAGQEVAYLSANQSTAGLQAQITTANNNATAAVVTANAAEATANGLAGSIATANSNASAAVVTADAAQGTANAAVGSAGAAQVTADAAQSAANAAQVTADAALSRGGGTMTGQINFVSGQSGLGLPNLLLNDNFKINQRGYMNGTPTTAFDEYTLDRWQVIVLGQSLSLTGSGGVRTATAPAGGFRQLVESDNMPTGTYVIDWEGTATCFVDGVQRFKGVAFSHTGGSDVNVSFFTGTVSKPKLERSGSPTPWIPRSIAEDLALCQRYFQAWGAGAIGLEETTTTFSLSGQLRPPMHATPTATLISTSINTRVVVTDRTLTSVSINSSQPHSRRRVDPLQQLR